ncbi:MAG: MFS transporter [Ktedonobacteraceae bacterium]
MKPKIDEGNARHEPHRLHMLLGSFGAFRSVPRIIWYCSISALFGYVSFFLLLSALPIYFSQLGYQPAQIGVIVGSTYALNFLAYFLTAIVSDRWGGRGYIKISALLLAIAPIIFELTHAIGLFILASIWQGLTMSAFATAIIAYVGQQASAEQRGTIMGLFGIFPNLAQAAAPPLGILLGLRFGFPLLFNLSAASAIVALLLAFILPPARIRSEQFHLRAWLHGVQRLARPAMVQFVVGVCRGVTIAFLPLYMLRGGVGNPGLFFTWQIVAIVLLRPVSGMLSDRYGRLAVILPGLVMSTVGIAILALSASYASLTASGIIFGIAVSVLVPTVLAWIFDVTGPEQRGLAAGVYNTLYDLGRAGSAFGFGFIIAVSGYPTMFLLVSLVPLAAIVVLLLWQKLAGPLHAPAETPAQAAPLSDAPAALEVPVRQPGQ